MSSVSRIYLAHNPFPPRLVEPAPMPWSAFGWPCRWIGCAETAKTPPATAYHCRFNVQDAAVIRVHVTADERYELFLDGERIGRGSGERGDSRHWSYETYDLALDAGEHLVAARVWSLGAFAPLAQMSAQPGFLFAPEDEKWLAVLGSGIADWQALPMAGYTVLAPPPSMSGVGGCFEVDAHTFPWGWKTGQSAGWEAAVPLAVATDARDGCGVVPTHRLEPATLPPMREAPWRRGKVRLVAKHQLPIEPPSTRTPVQIQLSAHRPDESGEWEALLAGHGQVTLAAGTARRVIIDLEDYCCAYPEMILSGGNGGCVQIRWAEACYENASLRGKSSRDEVDGKFFAGPGDGFLPDGAPGRRFESPWWRCGRYLEILAAASGEPLTIERFALCETRYPLEMENTFAASDPRLAELTPILLRGLQTCAHETYVDCPYFEQLQYVGDSALQALTGAQISRDDRLWRRYLRLTDASRPAGGFTASRYPSRDGQNIPSFSLCWVESLHDYARWRGDADFVRARLPGARALLDLWLSSRCNDGLIASPPGWNFVDWSPGGAAWRWGVPPGGEPGHVCAILNWHVVRALRQLAELEEWLGEPEFAARNRRLGAELAATVNAAFWNESSERFADDSAHAHFSEHAQCLAILSGALAPAQSERVCAAMLSAAEGTARTSVYFAHYWFEACRALGRMDAVLDRWEEWHELPTQGFCTTPENSDLRATRSDCHAWSATPLFHFFASILGVRPGDFGYRTVAISPQLGTLGWARGTAVHPLGEIAVDLQREPDGKLRALIELPDGLTGTFMQDGQTFDLRAGRQEICCS